MELLQKPIGVQSSYISACYAMQICCSSCRKFGIGGKSSVSNIMHYLWLFKIKDVALMLSSSSLSSRYFKVFTSVIKNLVGRPGDRLALDTRLDAMDARINELNDRFDDMDTGLGAIGTRFNGYHVYFYHVCA